MATAVPIWSNGPSPTISSPTWSHADVPVLLNSKTRARPRLTPSFSPSPSSNRSPTINRVPSSESATAAPLPSLHRSPQSSPTASPTSAHPPPVASVAGGGRGGGGDGGGGDAGAGGGGVGGGDASAASHDHRPQHVHTLSSSQHSRFVPAVAPDPHVSESVSIGRDSSHVAFGSASHPVHAQNVIRVTGDPSVAAAGQPLYGASSNEQSISSYPATQRRHSFAGTSVTKRLRPMDRATPHPESHDGCFSYFAGGGGAAGGGGNVDDPVLLNLHVVPTQCASRANADSATQSSAPQSHSSPGSTMPFPQTAFSPRRRHPSRRICASYASALHVDHRSATNTTSSVCGAMTVADAASPPSHAAASPSPSFSSPSWWPISCATIAAAADAASPRRTTETAPVRDPWQHTVSPVDASRAHSPGPRLRSGSDGSIAPHPSPASSPHADQRRAAPNVPSTKSRAVKRCATSAERRSVRFASRHTPNASSNASGSVSFFG